MIFKKYHRRYPDSGWDYKAISTHVNGREIIFYTLIKKGKHRRGVEIYNDDVTLHSYSRHYASLNSVPVKYKKIVLQLMRYYKSITWSTFKYVNEN